MASGDTLFVFNPMSYEPPASGYATPDNRNGVPCLRFDDTTQECALFSAIMPNNYGSGTLSIYVHHASASGTSGTIGWVVDFQRVGMRILDVDAENWGPSQIVQAATVSPTGGQLDIVSTTMVNGTGISNTSIGELFRFRIKRDVANDTCVNDAELYAIEIREL